jgi:DNA-binding NtrC family response regulator
MAGQRPPAGEQDRAGGHPGPDLDLEPPARTEGTATLREARDHAGQEALVAALAAHRGNISRAVEELRVRRPTLHALLAKHKVDTKQFR